jgi:nitrite reductase/ring-hydroxylating ferredoxin subunit
MSAAQTKPPKRHAVAKIAEVPVGERIIVKIPAFGKEIEVGVFNVGGRFFAYRNVCPHAGAPVCEGKICGTTAPSGVGEFILEREGEIVRCPWHGWEFDLLTGEHLVDKKMKLRPYAVETGTENLENYAVETEGETIYVLIGI